MILQDNVLQTKEYNHFGIDYGSKLAGTTAICHLVDGMLNIQCSKPKKSADDFLLNYLLTKSPGRIFIDAPLSLPEAYYGKGSDYFYRDCDRALSAMSPLFLGGLTARAISFKHKLPDFTFYETYPKKIQQIILPQNSTYKKDLVAFQNALKEIVPFTFQELQNWHQIDALLAWFSGYRFSNKVHLTFGQTEEGLIYI